MTTALTLEVLGQEVVQALHAYDEATDVYQVKVHRSTMQLPYKCEILLQPVEFCLVRAVHKFTLKLVRLNALQMAT
jgi:hypothetical protein